MKISSKNGLNVKMKKISILWLLIIFIGCNKMDKKVPLIPMEDFFRNPEKSSFQITEK